MNLVKTTDNIFTLKNNQFVAHLIDGDYTPNNDFAEKLNDVFDVSFSLFLYYPKNDIGDVLRIDNIYNLVVCKTYKDVAILENIRKAFENLRNQLMLENIKEIHIPKIDFKEIDWNEISVIIKDVFYSTDINVIVHMIDNELLNIQCVNDNVLPARKLVLYDKLVDFAINMVPDKDDLGKELAKLGFSEKEIEIETKKRDIKIKSSKNFLLENYNFEVGM